MGNFGLEFCASFSMTDTPSILISDPALFFSGPAVWPPHDKVFVLTDSRTRRLCLPLLRPFLPAGTVILGVPPGEASKNLASCEKIWETLTRNGATRHSLLLNLGGGMVGDLGGFAASVYKRGIAFIQIPTTLLAMVDSALGGKTGIDFQHVKNQLGTFSRPAAVWVFPAFLQTLPEAERLSGLAEMIKHTLIADAGAFDSLRKQELSALDWATCIPGSQAIKAAIVRADPFESGERQKLNAGHTLGHALEGYFLSQGSPCSHGACVAAGLVMESRIAAGRGLLDEAGLMRIEETIFSAFGVLTFPSSAVPAILRLCRHDKKNRNGEIRMALIGPIGTCSTGIPVTEAEIRSALRWYRTGA
jgi:3-dehydroquinate synthase